MSIVLIIILAIVQGITEFLPVSSSGHLVIIQEAFSDQSNLRLDVMLHLGTLLAVVSYFRKDLLKILSDIRSGNLKVALNLIIGSVPVAVAGFLAASLLDLDTLRSTPVVIVMLIVVAVLMLVVDKVVEEEDSPGKTDLSQISMMDALLIGVSQTLALIPGTSRSGITMLGGVWRGLTRVEAAHFSFLLGIPAIAGAALAVLIDVGEESEQISNSSLIIGVGVSAVVGYLAIGLLLRLVAKFGFKPFAYYRIGLALVLLVALVIDKL